MDLTDSQIKELDGMWRRAVLLGAGLRCEITGNPAGWYKGRIIILDAHHLIGRGEWAFRWELNNGVAVWREIHTNPSQIIRVLAETNDKRYRWYEKNRHIIIPRRELNYKQIYRKLAA